VWISRVERERTRSAAHARAAAGKSEWLAGNHGAAARRISAAASPSPPTARYNSVGSPSVQACVAAQQGESAGGGEGLKVREGRPAAAGDQPGGEVGVACM